MDDAELELFARTVRRATEDLTGEELDAALDELGWADAWAGDRRAAVSVLFECQGRANATSSSLERVVAAALGVGGDAFVVLPPLGGWHPPGERRGASFAVRGLATSVAARAHDAAVVMTTGGAAIVATAGLALRDVDGIDPSFGLVEVTAGAAAGEPVAAHDWPAAVAVARLAVGHELVGAARAMLELARAHALERVQFGRPISAFQAVRHRLAETLVVIEAADAMLVAAWEDGSPQTAAMAKALAGRGARVAVRHCQQVLAGIGFTTEHPFHRYLRRVLVLDQLFGASRTLTAELGRDLLRSRTLPVLQPL